MERNIKYHSNYSSQVNLSPQIDSNYIPAVNSKPEPTMIKFAKNSSQHKIYTQKQPSSILPYQNQYSYLNKYKKLDRFLEMQNYFHNLYGHKKQGRIERQKLILEQRQRQERQKQNKKMLTLPSIYQKQNTFEQQLMRVKLQGLQERLNRMQPMRVVDYSRFPPINQNPYNECKNCMNHQKSSKSIKGQGQNNQSLDMTQGKPRRIFTKQQKKRLISRFRICGYAIYFALIFPHYSLLFSHFKLKDFLQKYLIEGNKMIHGMNSIIIQKFKDIPIYEQIRQIHENYEEEKKKKQQDQEKTSNKRNLKNSKKQKQEDPKIKISNQQSQQNYLVNLNIFKRIINHFIKTFDSIVDQFDEEIYQFFGVGTLTTSYYADEIYSIEQMPFLYCNQDKGNLILTPDQQKALLISSFFIKKVINQFLIRLAVDPEWHQQLASFSKLKKKEVTFFRLVCKQIQLCSFFLYQLAIKSFYTMIQSQTTGNLYDQNDTSLPLPLRTMKFPSLFMSKSQRQLFNSGFQSFNTKQYLTQQSLKGSSLVKRSKQSFQSSNNSVSKFQSQYNWGAQEKQIFLQYEELIQEDPLNLIHNNFQFGQLSKIIGDYMKSSYQKAQKSILKTITKLRDKIILKRKKNYAKIHEKIMKKKFILTQEHQILQGVVFLRNNQEKKQVSICRKMLQIYLDVLGQNEIEARDNITELSIKRQLSKKRNANTIQNKSMISIVSRE